MPVTIWLITRPGAHCNSREGGPSSRCEVEGGGGGNRLERPDLVFFLLKLVQDIFLDKKWV